MSYTYKHPHFALTVDIILFNKTKEDLQILLIKRKNDPYKDCWAFPGGFVDINELIKDAALRELKEETNVDNVSLLQLGIYDAINRDPRERVISVAFYGFVDKRNVSLQANDDANAADWFSINALPPLAFDHQSILHDALARI